MKAKSTTTWSALVAFGGVAGVALWRFAAPLFAGRARRSPGPSLPYGVAVITGASSGIGAAFARQLAQAGYDLLLVARRADRLQDLAAELTHRYPIRAEIEAADLTNDEELARVEQRIADLENLVLLVNNAGFGTQGSFAESDLQPQLAMIKLHIVAAVRLIHAALPGLIRRRAGAIINVSSISAFFASPGGATYGATKVYLNTFSEALQAELQHSGVKVQALCPGFTLTEFHDTPEYATFRRSQVPDKLWMTADFIVQESLAALSRNNVIVIPGRPYRALIATTQSPLGPFIRHTARQIRRRLLQRQSEGK